MITFYDCTFIFDCWKIQFICTCVNQQKWDESALTRKKIVLLLFSHPVNGNGNWWQHIKYNRYWRKPHKQKETNRVLNGSATDEQTNLVPSIVVQLYHRGSHVMAQNSKISPNRKFVHSCMFLLSYIDIFFIRFTACTKKNCSWAKSMQCSYITKSPDLRSTFDIILFLSLHIFMLLFAIATRFISLSPHSTIL